MPLYSLKTPTPVGARKCFKGGDQRQAGTLTISNLSPTPRVQRAARSLKKNMVATKVVWRGDDNNTLQRTKPSGSPRWGGSDEGEVSLRRQEQHFRHVFHWDEMIFAHNTGIHPCRPAQCKYMATQLHRRLADQGVALYATCCYGRDMVQGGDETCLVSVRLAEDILDSLVNCGT